MKDLVLESRANRKLDTSGQAGMSHKVRTVHILRHWKATADHLQNNFAFHASCKEMIEKSKKKV